MERPILAVVPSPSPGRLPETEEAFIYVTISRIMLRRLA
jgi:hypothetical protein